MMASRKLGSGVSVGVRTPVAGTAVYVGSAARAMEIINEDMSASVLVVESSSVTGVAPILPDVLGVVCLSGGPTSHLALVAREFGVPCVMGATFADPPQEIDGLRLELEPDGTVNVSEAP
jgi:phosphohistidine swiveling domain-containing protein